MNGWIDINDKNPDIYEEVLVYIDPELGMNCVCFAYLDKKNNWIVTNAKGNHSDFITHWMPLPIPHNWNKLKIKDTK